MFTSTGIESSNRKTGEHVQIKVALRSNVYRRSAPISDHPQLVVTTTLLTPSLLTVEIRGEKDSGTILTDGFRAEHFNFYDLTTSKPVVYDLFPGTCDPWDALYLDVVKEMHSFKPNVARQTLEDVNPLSDPVNILKTCHEYRLTLKAQKVRCWDRSVAEIFRDREGLSMEETPEAMEVLLACEDELLLQVET